MLDAGVSVCRCIRFGVRRGMVIMRMGRSTILVAVVSTLAIAMSGCAFITQSSVASDGTPGNFDARLMFGARDVISDDGRYVVFESQSDNLVPNDTNTSVDVFRHDNVTRATVRVSVDDSGGQVDVGGRDAAMSADGRYVVFATMASLVAADTNGLSDVYRRDMSNGDVALVSVDENGDPNVDTNAIGRLPSISADGQTIAWISPTSGGHVHVRRMSVVGSTALAGAVSLDHPTVSRDGNHVYWNPYCGLKCPNPPIAVSDLANPYPFSPPDGRISDVSSDGRYVTETVSAFDQIFDRQTGNAQATDTTGLLGQASSDGRFRLSVGRQKQVLTLIDELTGISRRVNQPGEFQNPPPTSEYPFAMTPDGRYVTFAREQTVVFTTDAAFPVPVGLETGVLPRGADHVSVRIDGGFFLPNATVDGGAGITIHSTQFNANGSLTVVMSVAADAAVGDHTIKVRNPGVVGDSSGWCINCLAVT